MRVLLGNLREGGGFCLEDASAARRIRRRQPLLVSFYITFALKKGIRLLREMDLAIDPKTRNRCDRATIRELLQMRACDKIPDTDTSARLIREGRIEKL